MKFRFGLIAFLLILSSCGPTLKSTMDIPMVLPNAKKDSMLADPSRGIFVYVGEFIDQRAEKAIVILEDKKVTPRGDVGKSVAEGLERALAMYGFEMTDTAPLILSGEVRNWSASMSGGFTKNLESDAAVFVEILDPANKRVYSGVYKGFASIEAPSISEADIRSVLQTSMSEAVRQVTADKQLLKILTAF